jgi:hypothetical protein
MENPIEKFNAWWNSALLNSPLNQKMQYFKSSPQIASAQKEKSLLKEAHRNLG